MDEYTKYKYMFYITNKKKYKKTVCNKILSSKKSYIVTNSFVCDLFKINLYFKGLR